MYLYIIYSFIDSIINHSNNPGQNKYSRTKYTDTHQRDTGHRAVMNQFRNFLESSTIHGLTYISSTRKLVRLFWIFVVITGFSAASFMIYESFQAWDESPVSTNIETLPITKITFPKVTVCPPKNTFTDLNYDFMTTQNMKLSNDVRTNLSKYAVELLQDHLHHVVMTNFSKLQEENRYRKWYLGYTSIQGPSWTDHYDLNYVLDSHDTSGTIMTEHYGEQFDADKVETDVHYDISIYPPAIIQQDADDTIYGDVTLHFEVEKMSMKNIMSGYEKYEEHNSSTVNADIKTFIRNYQPPLENHIYYKDERTSFRVERKVALWDVKKMSMKLMPGFKFKWHYTWGSAGEVQPDQHYIDQTSYCSQCHQVATCPHGCIVATAFVRKDVNEYSILCRIYFI